MPGDERCAYCGYHLGWCGVDMEKCWTSQQSLVLDELLELIQAKEQGKFWLPRRYEC